MKTFLSKFYGKTFIKIRSVFHKYERSQMLKNLSKIPDTDPMAEDFRNLISSFLFTDTYLVEFSRRFNQ